MVEHSVFLLPGAVAVGAGVHVDERGVGDGLYFAAEDTTQILKHTVSSEHVFTCIHSQ
ncbi:hypothetical protein D3C78_1804940 [compost metagenome]